MIEDLQNKINYTFKNRDLLTTALTHRSFNDSSKPGGINNEKLEFLGDSVIGLMITDYIYRRYGDLAEGELAKLKSHLVSSNFLYEMAKRIDLGRCILLGKGEEKNNGRSNKNIISSAFEALVGALFLDSDFENVTGVILPLYVDFFDVFLSQEVRINDYKSELQELVQKHGTQLPVYKVVAEEGRPPTILFQVAVYIGGSEVGRGKGRNRREAEQEAAQAALINIGNLDNFKKLSDIFFIKDTPRRKEKHTKKCS